MLIWHWGPALGDPLCSQPQDAGGWGRGRGELGGPWTRGEKGTRKRKMLRLGGRVGYRHRASFWTLPQGKGQTSERWRSQVLVSNVLEDETAIFGTGTVPGVPITRRLTAVSLFKSLTMDSQLASGDSSSGGDFTDYWLSEHLRVSPPPPRAASSSSCRRIASPSVHLPCTASIYSSW